MKSRKSISKSKPPKDELFSNDYARRKIQKIKPKYNNKKYWLEYEDDDINEEELKDYLKFQAEEEE